MLLVDTTIWSVHLRGRTTALPAFLLNNEVLMQPFVQGELACGWFAQRAAALTSMSRLSHAPLLGHVELLSFIHRHALVGQGIGLIDLHLLGSALLAHVKLWTRDRRLSQAAAALGCGYVA